MEKRNEKQFMDHPTLGWVVSDTEDPGLVRAMTLAGGKREFNVQKQKYYWIHFERTKFASIMPLMQAAGFVEYVSGGKKEEENPGEEKTYTVEELNRILKERVSKLFDGNIWIRGEVLEFKVSSKGHVYFKLIAPNVSERGDKLSMVIWRDKYEDFKVRMSCGQLPQIKDGDEIRVSGRVQYYGSQISVCVEDIDAHFAEGEFYKRKGEILKRLELEGLADRNLNLEMPEIPLRIALFSNSTAAGGEDFIKTLRKGGYGFRVTWFHVSLQGQDVESSFVKAFERMARIGEDCFDVAVIVRGGGGLSELSVYNNYEIGRRIGGSRVKFLVAVGHDRDRSVLDEIAQSVITPTAAGECLNGIMERHEVALDRSRNTLKETLCHRLEEARNVLKTLSYFCQKEVMGRRHYAELQLQSFGHELAGVVSQWRDREERRVLEFGRQLSEVSREALEDTSQEMGRCVQILRDVVTNIVGQERRALDVQSLALCDVSRHALSNAERDLKALQKDVEMHDPNLILKKGYALLLSEDGHVVTRALEVSPGERLWVNLTDGRVGVRIETIEIMDKE